MQTNVTKRRVFLKQFGAGSLAAAGISARPSAMQAAVNAAEPMKITRIDAVTFRKDLQIGGGSGSRQEGAEWCCPGVMDL